MVGQFRARRLLVAMSLKKALGLIKSIAEMHGFEITETIDLDAVARRQTGTSLNRKITLVQMHKPAMTLGSALLDDILPLILPLRVVVREIGSNSTAIYFLDWDAIRDSEATQAQHCMNVLYRADVSQVERAFKESLMRAGLTDDAITQQKERTDVSSNFVDDGFIEHGMGSAFRARAGPTTSQPVRAGAGKPHSEPARRN